MSKLLSFGKYIWILYNHNYHPKVSIFYQTNLAWKLGWKSCKIRCSLDVYKCLFSLQAPKYHENRLLHSPLCHSFNAKPTHTNI